jgi:uncharacterized protein YbjT (DUF2867 family)
MSRRVPGARKKALTRLPRPAIDGRSEREPANTPRNALLVGATGLVGQHLLARLLADPSFVSVLTATRRPLGITHPKLTERIVDFESLSTVDLPPISDYFCCIGTTIRQAGSQPAFERVDHFYAVAFAQRALKAGALRCLFVSSLGADPRSRVFYNRVKGEVERDLGMLPFDGVIAFRPSLLAGRRENVRLGERLALAVLQPLGRLLPARLRPIAADEVARAMVAVSRRAPSGRLVIESDAIRTIAVAAP